MPFLAFIQVSSEYAKDWRQGQQEAASEAASELNSDSVSAAATSRLIVYITRLGCMYACIMWYVYPYELVAESDACALLSFEKGGMAQ